MYKHYLDIYNNISIRNFNWIGFSFFKKIVLVTFIVGFFSLFLAWKNILPYPINGFQTHGFLYLLAWLYPVLCILSNQQINKTINVLFGSYGFFMSFAFLLNSFLFISGYSVNISGIGSHLFFIASAINLYFVLKS